MSESIETVRPPRTLGRREFTLEAALAILAGCVITVSDACGGKSSPVAPTPPPADVSGVVSSNHGHVALVTGAQITGATAFSLNIQGTSSHPHTVSISQADLSALKNRQAITSTSSTDNGHTHTITFTHV